MTLSDRLINSFVYGVGWQLARRSPTWLLLILAFAIFVFGRG